MNESTSNAASAAPLVSVILLAYNQQHMVRRAAQACLAQEGGPYEIVFSDDASTDDTFEELQRVAAAYRGPHRVTARRNEANVGIGEHYNQLVRATAGELIVTAAGDDVSLPHRVRRIVEAWEASGRRADLIASHVIDLDDDGRTHDVIRVDDLGPYRGVADWGESRPYIIGAGHAFTRRMMERFGPFQPTIAYEDQIMVFRAIAMGGAVTIDEPLVLYRRGGTSARPPVFDSTEHMVRWRDRQLRRELAEKQQLIADAEVAGCGDQVRKLLERSLRRDHYVMMLRDAPTREERWRMFRQAQYLPVGWRFKKLLHALYPNATMHVKRGLAVFHRSKR